MKISSKSPTARSGSPARPTGHRRHLEKLLKQALAGKISLEKVAASAEATSAPSYRRIIE